MEAIKVELELLGVGNEVAKPQLTLVIEQQIVQVPACTEGFTSNLGKATSNGFDFQAEALITDSLKIGLSMGYTNARNATTIVSGGMVLTVSAPISSST